MINVNKVLYILQDNIYISCEHDSFVIKMNDVEKQRVPVTIIQQIIVFGNATVSAYLIGYCSEHSIMVSYVSSFGDYYGGLRGKSVGNILLRQKQYRLYDNADEKLRLVKNIVLVKGENQKSLLAATLASANEEDAQSLSNAISKISDILGLLHDLPDVGAVRGTEGSIASIYFSVFDHMIKIRNTGMCFEKRSKRPPENNCNAIMSFLYVMLTLNCVSAVECFGLDSYMGYLHELRPGRESLACDLVEEFRAPIVDRFVIRLINRKQITERDFESQEGDIRLSDDGKKKILQLWEAEKETKVLFPLYQKNVPIKLLPYLQAQLLSEYIRGDLPDYPPYIWEA